MIKYLYFLLIGVLISSCTLTDNDQPLPAYLEITDVNLITNQFQGEPTHNISEIWAYADNQLLGVFEIPCKIPVLTSGETTEFLIFPGFRNNGVQSKSFTYNLMDQIRFTETMNEGDLIQKSLTFVYKDDAKFDFIEGFEGGSHIFSRDLDEDESSFIEATTDDKKSGAQSGKISLTQEKPTLSAASIFDYNRVDNAGKDSYLEMDYKNDGPFVVGVLYVQEGQKVAQPLILLNASDNWNKIYIDYTSILSSPLIETYSVYISSDIESSSIESGTIYLDNLKFVHL